MIRKKIKVAAYARVSTDKDDQLNSLDNQRIYFQNYIKGHPDWEFVDVYWDEGISGTQTKNRVYDSRCNKRQNRPYNYKGSFKICKKYS